jgi:hypothetical protein
LVVWPTLGRRREPECVVLDNGSVWRCVVINPGEAHAPLSLLAAITTTRASAVLAEEVGSANSPFLQCPQYFFLILAHEAMEQDSAVLFLSYGEVWISSVFVSRTKSLVAAVILLYSLEASKDAVDRTVIAHG